MYNAEKIFFEIRTNPVPIKWAYLLDRRIVGFDHNVIFYGKI
jgi:hypothetical protein